MHADSFDGEVSFLSNWLTARAVWMSQDEAIFGVASSRVRERAQVIEVPVRILADQVRPAQVAYAVQPSSAERGEDFRVIGSTLTFGPGETVKTIRLRILEDDEAEGPEKIMLQLVGAASGVRSATRPRCTFTIMKNDQ